MKEALKELRNRAGLSQSDVAAALNIKQTTVSMWESGDNKPRAALLPAIAQLYGCTIDELFDGKEETV